MVKEIKVFVSNARFCFVYTLLATGSNFCLKFMRLVLFDFFPCSFVRVPVLAL